MSINDKALIRRDFPVKINNDLYDEYLLLDAQKSLNDKAIEYSKGSRILMTSPANIHNDNYSNVDVNSKEFWEMRMSKDKYMDLASHIPEVKQRLSNGESLESLSNDDRIGRCVDLYFGTGEEEMPRVYQFKDTFICESEGGRHRIQAAQELGYEIPVQVIGAYSEDGETPAEDSGNFYEDISNYYQQTQQYSSSQSSTEPTRYKLPQAYLDAHPDVASGQNLSYGGPYAEAPTTEASLETESVKTETLQEVKTETSQEEELSDDYYYAYYR